MEKIYYNKDGWVCERVPQEIPIDDPNRYIEVEYEDYLNTLAAENGKAWRVVKGKLEQQVYDTNEYKKNVIFEEITALKQEIIKAKEDVEQVELFYMERTDYERKKARCVEIVLRLRELEARLKELSKEGE